MDVGPITDHAVRQALECIRSARSLAGNPLLGTGLVRGHLAATNIANSATGRELALAAVLSRTVETQLATARRVGAESGASPTGKPDHLARRIPMSPAALRVLEADFLADDPRREAWSALFFRYIAVPPLQVKDIAAVVRSGSRYGRTQVARRIGLGVHLLALALRHLEAAEQRGDGAEHGVDGSAAGTGPPTASGEAHHNLPRRRNSFIGRETESLTLVERLAQARLVTITGPPGTGKTRLMLEVLPLCLDGWPDGAWLVELAGVREASGVGQAVDAVLDVAGLPVESGLPGSVQRLTARLAGRRLLVVLDNCEHLADVCARLVDQLLNACPGLSVLATSRERLGVDDEALLRLRPLPVPGAEQTELAALWHNPAVRLFDERAGSVEATLDADRSKVRTVAEICRRLDGLPLAIELTAARLSAFSIDDVLAHLTDRSALLAAGPRTAWPHQQTLWRAVDWSYQLLDEDERLVLQRLSVFHGGWCLPEAKRVCGDESGEGLAVPLVLGQLVNKSLVEHWDDGLGGRYRLLESLRVYAAERLAESRFPDAARLRHTEAYLALAEAAAPGLFGAEQRVWLDRLQREHDNFQAALATGLELAPEMGLALAKALCTFWHLRGYYDEGRAWMAQFLDRATEAAPTARVEALIAAGKLATWQGDFGAARKLLQEGISWAQETDAVQSGIDGQAALGIALSYAGDFAAAQSVFAAGIVAARATRPPHAALREALWGRGNLAVHMGEYELARSCLNECLELAGAADDLALVARVCLSLGHVACQVGEYGLARSYLGRSLAGAGVVGDVLTMSASMWGLSRTALALGDHREVRVRCAELAQLVRHHRLLMAVPYVLEQQGYLVLVEGESLKAARLLGAAERQREVLAAPLPPAALEEWQRYLRKLQASLGATDLEQAWATGRALSWAAALAEAVATRRDGGA